MELNYILSNIILWIFFQHAIGARLKHSGLKKYESPCPNECDLNKCPKLQLCDGDIVKDRCNCCPDCSTDIKFNSTYTKKDGACKQVKCHRFQVCMENMQGLPLCTCPNLFVCKTGRKNDKRAVCGKDGKTYLSRCHMRVMSCGRKPIRMAHKGACGMVGTQQHGSNVKYAETEFDISAKRRKNRKQIRRKQRKAQQRRRRKQRNRKNRKAKRRRGKKRTTKDRNIKNKPNVKKT